VDLREILNAIRYMARAGVGWRMLPHDFPPWQTVYWWFRRFVRRLLFRTLHGVALMLDCERMGAQGEPHGGADRQPEHKGPAGTRGGRYDAAKKVKRRCPLGTRSVKRHVVVDTDRRLLMVNLSAADVQDAAGAEEIIKTIRKRWSWLKHLDTPINLATGRAVVTEVMREGDLAVYGHGCPVSVASLGGLEVG
jgi:transposase